jgi:selenocysteine lyase/cysteine desulfurase
LPAYFFSQSSALIRFVADCLFANARRVLITDLAWPPYVDVLRRVAKKRDAQLIEIPLRGLVRNELSTKSDVLEFIMLALQRNACDGMFLSDITYEGTRLPVVELLTACQRLVQRPFAIIDGAQAFRQRPLSLNKLNCDLYLAGSQKWLGAYHPLRMVFVASDVNQRTIETTATNLSKHSNADALFRFTRSLERADFASFGETVNLSALVVAAGALRQAEREAATLHHPWEVLRTNAQSLSSWVEGHGWHVRQHVSLGSGIVLLTSSRKCGNRSSRALKQQLGLEGIIASAFPDGNLRLSMPRFDLSLSLQTRILCALDNAAIRRCIN